MAVRWNNLGLAWYSLAKNEKAIEYYEKSLTILEKRLENDHPYTISVREKLQSIKN
jgi:tetratricopeptide (TPR) repeat protein